MKNVKIGQITRNPWSG